MHAVTFLVNVPVFYRTKQREGVAQTSEELLSAEKSRENRLNELKFELKQQYLFAKAADQLLNLYTKATNFTTLLNYETDYYRQVADHEMGLARIESLIGMELTTATADLQGPKVVQK